MKIIQKRDSLSINGYPTPSGKRSISIYRHYDDHLDYVADAVRYNDRFFDVIVEYFDGDGLYDCNGRELPGDEPWLVERVAEDPKFMDLCYFCKHARRHEGFDPAYWNLPVRCKLGATEPNVDCEGFKVVDCDKYERWDE